MAGTISTKYNLKPHAVKLHSNSCCTDTNNFTKLIKNISSIILTIHEISKFVAVQKNSDIMLKKNQSFPNYQSLCFHHAP